MLENTRKAIPNNDFYIQSSYGKSRFSKKKFLPLCGTVISYQSWFSGYHVGIFHNSFRIVILHLDIKVYNGIFNAQI